MWPFSIIQKKFPAKIYPLNDINLGGRYSNSVLPALTNVKTFNYHVADSAEFLLKTKIAIPITHYSHFVLLEK